jgi:hypothetical protein
MVPRDTLIIIIVASAVGALVLLALFARFVSRQSVVSNPLPPVQPLAHHREQQLTKLDLLPRSQTWYSQNTLAAPPPFASITPRGSRTSLLPKSPPTPYTDDSISAPSSPSGYSHSLAIPAPLFHPTRPASSASLITSSDHSSSLAQTLDSELQPPSAFPSPPDRRGARPLSMSSSHSTVYSKHSRHNTIRGTPHGPHSQVQIVLPTPLAPELSSSNLRGLTRTPDLARRRSVVDLWVSNTVHGKPFMLFYSGPDPFKRRIHP